jgi:hypothetical protein
MKKILLTFISVALLAGCASVNSVSLTPIPSQRSRPVKAETSKLIILGFNFDNDFVDPLVEDLKQQCPNGVVSGILTKDEIISYFLAHTRRVTATGFCNVSAGNVSAGKVSAGKVSAGKVSSAAVVDQKTALSPADGGNL